MRNTTRQARENRTLTVDFQNEATYFQLFGDGKAFLEWGSSQGAQLEVYILHSPLDAIQQR
jgi:hypothetical protein